MKFATAIGPLPFAEKFVSNPRRDRHIVRVAAYYQQQKEADERLSKWGYHGLFYSDSTKGGATKAQA